MDYATATSTGYLDLRLDVDMYDDDSCDDDWKDFSKFG